MNPRLQIVSLVSLLVSLLFLAGCLRSTPPPEYYALVALSPKEPNSSVAANLRLGVVIKAFPEALERAQILTREGYQVKIAEQHRWAAPLRQELERVLGVNFGRLLGSERVAVAPWPSYFIPTRRLMLEVLQFDGALCGELLLQARWALTDAGGKSALVVRTSTLRETADCSGYPGYVAAQSRALAALSSEIAEALAGLSQP